MQTYIARRVAGIVTNGPNPDDSMSVAVKTSAAIGNFAVTVSFVARKPGLRIEQINRELGASTKELMLPVRKLIAAGAINTKGAKRATQYFPSTK
jgi:hypothetical protein